MQYNLHPIFVHFPIALLFVYSLLKIIPLQRWLPKVRWKDIEIVLLVFGVLGAFAGLITGETAQHLTQPPRALVQTHSFYATFATWLYGALLFGELCALFNRSSKSQIAGAVLSQISKFFEKILTSRILSVFLAFIALVALLVAGMLGGIMVYGTSADPLAAPLLKLLGITL